MDKVEKNNKLQKIAFYFFIYAFIGWIFEEVFCIATTHEFIKRGFLFGPICPMYGYGAIILILCFDKYKEKTIKVFVLSALIFSIFEYITDFLLQSMFAKRFWDYTGYFFNLNSRIAISFSIIWGIISVLFIKLLHPCIEKVTEKILAKIPSVIKTILIVIMIISIAIDTTISCAMYSGVISF